MTGFGRSEKSNEEFVLKVEIKSLNGKYMDLDLKLPKFLGESEMKLRKQITEFIGRGSAQVNISFTNSGKEKTNNTFSLNSALAVSYKEKLDELASSLSLDPNNLFNIILNMPDVIEKVEQTENEGLSNMLFETVNEALHHFDQYRNTEGESIKKSLIDSCNLISSTLAEIEKLEPERRTLLRDRLEAVVESLKTNSNIDASRFEQELLYYLEKYDINEEKSRLSQHCSYFNQCIEKEPSGKKLGFIAQEMTRESNTLGVKSNHFEMQQLSVKIKEEIEKIKEQVLNIV